MCYTLLHRDISLYVLAYKENFMNVSYKKLFKIGMIGIEMISTRNSTRIRLSNNENVAIDTIEKNSV